MVVVNRNIERKKERKEEEKKKNIYIYIDKRNKQLNPSATFGLWGLGFWIILGQECRFPATVQGKIRDYGAYLLIHAVT